MNHLFIIQAHNQLPLLENLVELLDAPNHFFLIHIDKKSKKLLEHTIIKDLKKKINAEIVSYKSVNWGGLTNFY